MTKRSGFTKHSALGWLALLLAPAALGAKGCEVAVVGADCGGITGAACGEGEYCDFTPEALCGAADQTGTCREIPDFCTREFNPVCGCDGQTYSNPCTARAAGVSVASEGECAPAGGGDGGACGGLTGAACAPGEFCNFPLEAICGAADQTGVCEPIPELCTEEFDPVCGCDDQTYGNACAANAAGVSVASEGECAPAGGGNGASCGGLTGAGCAPGEFCNFPLEAICGAADQTGTCAPIPEVCTFEFNPVCGCDDQTYGNACAANAAGVSVVSLGECAPAGGGNGGACGGITGAACAPGEFCNFPIEAICGAADQTGVCEAIPEFCTEEFNPVCGCDDQTYGNACAANAAGVSVASEGECGASGGGSGTVCGGLLGAGCSDGEFCNFPLEAICGAADQTGVCEAIPDACTLEFNPVCGCDDQTYGNACEAHAAGVSVALEGECP